MKAMATGRRNIALSNVGARMSPRLPPARAGLDGKGAFASTLAKGPNQPSREPLGISGQAAVPELANDEWGGKPLTTRAAVVGGGPDTRAGRRYLTGSSRSPSDSGGSRGYGPAAATERRGTSEPSPGFASTAIPRATSRATAPAPSQTGFSVNSPEDKPRCGQGFPFKSKTLTVTMLAQTAPGEASGMDEQSGWKAGAAGLRSTASDARARPGNAIPPVAGRRDDGGRGPSVAKFPNAATSGGHSAALFGAGAPGAMPHVNPASTAPARQAANMLAPTADGPVALPAGLPPEAAAAAEISGDSGAPNSSNRQTPTEGDVYLDGTLVGRWMARTLAREAGRPPSGGTAFDATRSRLPPGTMIGA
jgi:hypothetical protein